MKWVFNDGGRSQYFKANEVGDCVTRALAIVLNRDYKEVYDETRKFLGYTPRNGVRIKDVKKLCLHFGLFFHPMMTIGSGCKCHLTEEELPKGRIICSVSKHLTAVVDHVIQDTFDPSREGKRCVYGYYTLKAR